MTNKKTNFDFQPTIAYQGMGTRKTSSCESKGQGCCRRGGGKGTIRLKGEKELEGGGSIIALRKGRRRRHRCRGVINGRGRRGSARVSVFSLQETKNAPYRHPMIKTLSGQLLSCGMFMAAEANFGGLAEEEGWKKLGKSHPI